MEILIMTLSWQEMIIINCSGLCCWSVQAPPGQPGEPLPKTALLTRSWPFSVLSPYKIHLFKPGRQNMQRPPSPKLGSSWWVSLCCVIHSHDFFCLKNQHRDALHVRWTPNGRARPRRGGEGKQDLPWWERWRVWALGKPSVKDETMCP